MICVYDEQSGWKMPLNRLEDNSKAFVMGRYVLTSIDMPLSFSCKIAYRNTEFHSVMVGSHEFKVF